jgi:hypothetical protein
MFSFEDISDWFWDIIQQADKNPDILASILMEMPKKSICRFQYEFESTLYLVWDDVEAKLRLSEDGTLETCGWIVSQGKDYFVYVKNHPDGIPETNYIDFSQSLYGVADGVYLELFDEFLPVPPGGYYYNSPWKVKPGLYHLENKAD